jgi:hypothetical protein
MLKPRSRRLALLTSLLLACACGGQRPAMDKGSTIGPIAKAPASAAPKADAAPPPGDFRSAHWGDSAAAVKSYESAKLLEAAADGLAYDGETAGLKASILYQFVDDKLVSGGYVFNGRHVNTNLFINEYTALQGLLKEKYGAPKAEKMVWHSDLFRNDPAQWGTAVASGALTYFSAWETPETKITLVLTGDNFKVNFGLQYRSRRLENLEAAATRKGKLKGL